MSCYLYDFNNPTVFCNSPVVNFGDPPSTSDTNFAANIAVNPNAWSVGNIAAVTTAYIGSIYVTNNSFVGVAAGSISTSALLDIWMIDDAHNITNVQSGL